MEVAEYNMQAAKIKFELGMLSLIAYTQAQNDYLKQQAALFKAEDDLFKAYREYEWARKGLIATSAQGAMSR
jgi:outer membrane protein TolC